MERVKRILYRLLFPDFWVVLLSVPTAAALLIYIFVFAGEDSLISYPSYVFSAYSLVIVCAWLARNFKSKKDGLDALIHKVPLAHRYVTDVSFKLHVSLYLSLGLNLLYAAMKFFYGFYYHSVWFGTLAAYYMLLALMRFILLRHAGKNGFGKNMTAEWRRYRLCGFVLMLMNAALSGVVVLMVWKNEGFSYAGYLIYAMALYAFYNVITAVLNVVKYRKYNSPAMSAAKVINLAAALVSMLSLETAMLAQFEKEEDPAAFRQIMTGTTGGCVCLIVLGIAVFMLIRSTGQLRKLNTERSGN